ncbi:hypothetical protein BGX28_000699, partial [Mortierella sp. GBA30]
NPAAPQKPEEAWRRNQQRGHLPHLPSSRANYGRFMDSDSEAEEEPTKVEGPDGQADTSLQA